MKVRIHEYLDFVPYMKHILPMTEPEELIRITVSQDRVGDCMAVSAVAPPKSYEVLEYRLAKMDGRVPEYEFARTV